MYIELDSGDCRVTFQDGPDDAMHPVHDSTIDSEDDRVRQIRCLNKTHVVGYVAHGELRPVRSVQLPDGVDRHLFDREIAAQLDEAVHIPRVEPGFPRPEVVLLPHPLI